MPENIEPEVNFFMHGRSRNQGPEHLTRWMQEMYGAVAFTSLFVGGSILSLSAILPPVIPFGIICFATGIATGFSNATGLDYVTHSMRMVRKASNQLFSGIKRVLSSRLKSNSAIFPEQRSLQEVLEDTSKLGMSVNAAIASKLDGIRFLLEEENSLYRKAAVDFISCLPDGARACDVVFLSDYYFSNQENMQTEKILKKMMPRERTNFFVKNLININNGDQLGGRINNPKISQALFFSLLVGSIKNKDSMLGEDVSEEIKRKASLLPEEIEKLEAALERHLLTTYNECKGDGNVKMAVLHGHQLVRDGEISKIGRDDAIIEVSSLNLQEEEVQQEVGDNSLRNTSAIRLEDIGRTIGGGRE